MSRSNSKLNQHTETFEQTRTLQCKSTKLNQHTETYLILNDIFQNSGDSCQSLALLFHFRHMRQMGHIFIILGIINKHIISSKRHNPLSSLIKLLENRDPTTIKFHSGYPFQMIKLFKHGKYTRKRKCNPITYHFRPTIDLPNSNPQSFCF